MARDRDDKTRYGMPPLGDPFEPFPAQIPWDVPIAQMTNWWLHVEAGKKTTRIPLRLMAGEQGWQKTLREILPRLKDETTRQPPDRVWLIAAGGQEFRDRTKAEGRYHVLLGSPPDFGD